MTLIYLAFSLLSNAGSSELPNFAVFSVANENDVDSFFVVYLIQNVNWYAGLMFIYRIVCRDALLMFVRVIWCFLVIVID